MNKKIKDNYVRRGFTLVEILAVLVVISILIGLLVPVLTSVKEMAAILRQKAQFAAIEIGLEAFNNDFGDYPNSDRDSGSVINPDKRYCGAQKLAEAMVGMDGFGFHKDSIFGHDALSLAGKLLYGIDPDDEVLWAQSRADRKGPYLELEAANAVSLRNIYTVGAAASPLLEYDSLVLADKFGLLKNAATGKKTGKPILYFRANTNQTQVQDVYDNNDNIKMVELDNYNHIKMFGQAGSDVDNFDVNFKASIINPNFTVPPRPYRAESFILLSAGPDGLYGTADDVFNFDVEK